MANISDKWLEGQYRRLRGIIQSIDRADRKASERHNYALDAHREDLAVARQAIRMALEQLKTTRVRIG